MAKDAAARLVQDEVAQGIVAGDPAALLPDRVARRGRDAADDDVAHLALGMGGDDVDGLAAAHGVDPFYGHSQPGGSAGAVPVMAASAQSARLPKRTSRPDRPGA